MLAENKILKIHCIGDSLALPGHGNIFDDTWFYKLQINYPNYIFSSYFKRALTTNVLISEGGGDREFPGGADCLEFYLPDVVIIQLGIVDCAPRYLKRSSLSYKIIERLPSTLKKLTYTLVKKIKSRSIKNSDVSLIQFEHYLEVYIKRCLKNNVSKIIFIKICTPDKKIQERSPELIQSINLFNEILEKLNRDFNIVKLIDPLNSSNDSNIFDDGYHPNKKGNELVFKELKNNIELV